MFDFNNFFIFDLANNHQGDVAHGKNIINAVAEVANEFSIRATIKFQFRELDTFIHPDFQKRTDLKMVNRFQSTRMQESDFVQLLELIRSHGMHTISTPFDEPSVDLLCKLKIDLIKIASCSAADRPLLEKIASANKPVILSTAGLNLRQIDRTVSLLMSQKVHFAIMHCVAIYPTPTEKLQLNQIDILRKRYPGIPIGFSTHEDPNSLEPITIAVAKKAKLFEKHVGIATKKYELNQYSVNPDQLRLWLQAYMVAQNACGSENRVPASEQEIESLRSLKRGIFVKDPVKQGETIRREQVFFAMPLQENQLTSDFWNDHLVADRDYQPLEAINNAVGSYSLNREDQIYEIMLQVRAMLNQAKIMIGKESSVEISHHYGLDRFREFGAVIVNCVNRTYCKKLIVQLPRQKHPYHFHKKKEETFQLLYGDLHVEIDGTRTSLNPGDTILIQPKNWHKFHTLNGAIFEEISTTHYNGDSYYEDEQIQSLPREVRKTIIENWEKAARPQRWSRAKPTF